MPQLPLQATTQSFSLSAAVEKLKAPDTMKNRPLLPCTLDSAVLDIAAFRSGDEAAWKKAEAREVISIATSLGLAVIGIEVWLPGQDGPVIPIPFFYSWTAREVDLSDWNDYRSSVNALAAEYVENFAWDTSDVNHQAFEPLFNLTFSSREPS